MDANSENDKVQKDQADTARSVFVAWERLRVLYNLLLAAAVLCVGGSSLGERDFWRMLLIGAIHANICYCLGPVFEGYLSWIGANRRGVRVIVFVLGTLFASIMAAGSTIAWRFKDWD